MGGFVNARWCWIIVGFLCLPVATAAEVLTLGIGTEGNFYSESRESGVDDGNEWTIRVLPHGLLEDDEGELRWKLRYKPNYEWVVTSSEYSGFTHLVNGTLTWAINPATTLLVSENFGFYESVVRFNEVVTEAQGEEVVEVTDTGFRDDQSIRNRISASLTHMLAPNRSVVFRVGHHLAEYDRERRGDRETVSVAGHFLQTVSARNTLGFGVSYRRSSLDGSSFAKDQSTDFFNLFGTWNYRFDETFMLSVALGPTWVKGDDRETNLAVAEDRRQYPLLTRDGKTTLVKASSCPREDGTLVLTGDCDVIDEEIPAAFLSEPLVSDWNPRRDLQPVGSVPSSSNETLTYFANIRLSKSWERWSGSIAYSRQQSDSSGLGSAAVADILSGVLDWKPAPRWRYALNASLTRQTSATEGVATVMVVESANLNANPPPGFFFDPVFSDVAESVAVRLIEVENDLEYLTFSVRLDVRYQATRKIELGGSITYWNQQRDGVATRVDRDYDRYRITFGVRYVFDPIRL
jgi:hypothetical protein